MKPNVTVLWFKSEVYELHCRLESLSDREMPLYETSLSRPGAFSQPPSRLVLMHYFRVVDFVVAVAAVCCTVKHSAIVRYNVSWPFKWIQNT